MRFVFFVCFICYLCMVNSGCLNFYFYFYVLGYYFIVCLFLLCFGCLVVLFCFDGCLFGIFPFRGLFRVDVGFDWWVLCRLPVSACLSLTSVGLCWVFG